MTGRLLLLRGPAGCGKSSVAQNIARVLKRSYFETTVTSRTEAQDLMWRFDAVRRLGDAQARRAGPQATWQTYHPYIEPGVLWWLFDETSAAQRGLVGAAPDGFEPATPPVIYRPSPAAPLRNAVLLIDEIDKAEPDVPNNLLVALGSSQFRVDEINYIVSVQDGADVSDLPLIILTTNEERQLPAAFLRRCIVYRFEGPDDARLVSIAERSEGAAPPTRPTYYQDVAAKMRDLAEDAGGEGAPVSIAEYLDAVRAGRRLGAETDDTLLDNILSRTASKLRVQR